MALVGLAVRVACSTLLAIVFAGRVLAIEPVTFEPPAALVKAFDVKDGNTEFAITVSDIESLNLYRVTTTSPWEAGELTFEGALFRDVLKRVGLDDADAVRVTGSDNYSQIVPREDWEVGPLLLATRQDGVLLTRRTQGPTRLVYPLEDNPAFDTELRKPRWVWLIGTIERMK